MSSASGQIPATRSDRYDGAETAENAEEDDEDDEDDEDEGRRFSGKRGSSVEIDLASA